MRFITFYLPQYHPIPENDTWWGKGFTDWVNVRRATPRYPGHYQPHEPGELGYYDLRDPVVREAQANLAREHGIDAFCYYHYWFKGRRLLHEPLDEVLRLQRPDFSFCLCWANENWTRAWDGNAKHVLIAQEHSREDDIGHIEWLIPVLKDRRYLTVNGRPLLLIYRPDAIPHVAAMLGLWRERIGKAGLPGAYICAVRSNFRQNDENSLARLGFDAIVDFQPNMRDWPAESIWRRAERVLGRRAEALARRLGLGGTTGDPHRQRIVPYIKVIENVTKKPPPTAYRRFPCVFPSWDNSPRRALANIIQNDSPEAFGRWLAEAANGTSTYPEDERIVFINAWNEWAEGCHLEPDRKMGRGFLREVQKVKNAAAQGRAATGRLM
jgi:lipopolysaccharide biosynthesis protein